MKLQTLIITDHFYRLTVESSVFDMKRSLATLKVHCLQIDLLSELYYL